MCLLRFDVYYCRWPCSLSCTLLQLPTLGRPCSIFDDPKNTGLTCQSAEDGTGAVIVNVKIGSAADDAKLKVSDVIYAAHSYTVAYVLLHAYFLLAHMHKMLSRDDENAIRGHCLYFYLQPPLLLSSSLSNLLSSRCSDAAELAAVAFKVPGPLEVFFLRPGTTTKLQAVLYRR